MKTFLLRLGFKNALLIIGALLFIIVTVDSKCTSERLRQTEAKLARTEMNLRATQDTLRVTKDNVGNIEYDKLSFIAKDLQELKAVNAELSKEIAETKGKVATIQKTGFKIAHDTVYLQTQVSNVDGLLVVKGRYDTTYSPGNYRKLATETRFNPKDSSAQVSVTEDEIGFKATTGIRQTDKGYEIFVKPQYPGLSITSLEGAVIEKNLFKQPKRRPALVTIGVQLGWVPLTYDFTNKKAQINPAQIGAGVGINFNLLRIFNK